MAVWGKQKGNNSMRIDCGKYILNTDQNENMWIEEKFIGKDKNKNEKESTRMVAGYLRTFESLAKDFLKKKVASVESEQLIDVLNALKQAELEIDGIYIKYKEELSIIAK